MYNVIKKMLLKVVNVVNIVVNVASTYPIIINQVVLAFI